MTTISLTTPSIRLPQAADPSAQHPAAPPAVADGAKPKSPSYFSPVVRIDPQAEVAVWEVRDPQTGEVVRQYPTEAMIKAYRAHAGDGSGAPPTK